METIIANSYNSFSLYENSGKKMEKPSWLKWPPNCCEACVGWQPNSVQYAGKCNKSDSLECGTTTDSRFRCPAFQRKDGV